MIDDRDVPDILLDALTYGRTEVVVSEMDSDSYMANKMLDSLKKHKAVTDAWRFYTISMDGQTKVIVMSPRCTDPEPPSHVNSKKKAQPKPKPEPQKKSLLAEWVLQIFAAHACCTSAWFRLRTSTGSTASAITRHT